MVFLTHKWAFNVLVNVKRTFDKRKAFSHDSFICWITFHVQEFQSAAIRKKLKLTFTQMYCVFVCPSLLALSPRNEVLHKLQTPKYDLMFLCDHYIELPDKFYSYTFSEGFNCSCQSPAIGYIYFISQNRQEM